MFHDTRPGAFYNIFERNLNIFHGSGEEQVTAVHELGVLYQAIRTVDRIAGERNIRQVKHITLEVGTESTFVPAYLEKLFPVAIDRFPVMKDSRLRLRMVPGRRLVISEIGY